MKTTEREEDLRMESVVGAMQGFTLLEAMVVILIASILTAAVVPSYQRMMGRARLNGATRELIADLMRTRMQCVSENRAFRFEFSGNSYRILRDNDRNGTIDSSEVLNVRQVAKSYPGVSITARSALNFNTRGIVNADTIFVTNTNGTKNVVINMVGRIHVEE